MDIDVNASSLCYPLNFLNLIRMEGNNKSPFGLLFKEKGDLKKLI